MDTIKPTLSEIMAASRRLGPILHHTELDLSSTFSRMTGGNIYLKCENRQKTGSFKIRGASNKLAAIEADDRLVHRDKNMDTFAQELAEEDADDDVEYLDDDEIEDLEDFEYEEGSL